MFEMWRDFHFSPTTSHNTTMFGLFEIFDCVSGRWFGDSVAEIVRDIELCSETIVISHMPCFSSLIILFFVGFKSVVFLNNKAIFI